MIETIAQLGVESLGRYYSIYRGVVTDNEDPEKCNRLKVYVPSLGVYIEEWAYPRNQHGAPDGSGFKFLSPKIGDIVFVEFEYGNPLNPIWSFCGWAIETIPDELSDNDTMGIITPNGNKIYLRDSDGKTFIETNGDINIKSKGTIIINNGNNEGLINIIELTNKLNQLVDQYNTMVELYNTHTHQVGTLTSTVSSGLSEKATKFDKSDYEDIKVKH